MFRFGDFTFDPQSGDLASPRGATRLQPQAAAVLTMLIEHAGSVVARADLQRRLWPDTTVEFDDGLNTCVRQIRVALADDASAPRYVETLPRRGYRFLATVEPVAAPPAVASSSPPPPSADLPRQRTSRRTAIVAAGLMLIVAAGALGLAALGRRAAAPGRGVAIHDFKVDTTDRLMVAYQRGLMTALLDKARRERDWRLVGDSAATYVVSGSLARTGATVRIFAQLMQAHDRKHLWAEDIVDTYPFAGNSTVMGERIESTVARVLSSRAP